MVETGIESFAEDRNNVVAELCAHPNDAEVIVPMAGHYTTAANFNIITAFDQIFFSISGAKVKEYADSTLCISLQLRELLVEAIDYLYDVSAYGTD
jgi:hypothetical protein